MNKHIALSLLIISPSFVHGMENDSSFLSSFSFDSFLSTWFSSNQVHHESKLSDLRKSKSKFENQLRDKKIKQELKGICKLQTSMALYNITVDLITFLQYCYYLKFHKNIIHMHLNSIDTALLKNGQKAQLDGYSALGASMIAKDISSIDKKRNFIQILIDYDFKPTPKDRELAELILYDGIVGYQKTILHLSHVHSQANWSVLPQEIRTQIAQYMIQLFKNEFLLLPETALNNL